jgi:hypothetical protein
MHTLNQGMLMITPQVHQLCNHLTPALHWCNLTPLRAMSLLCKRHAIELNQDEEIPVLCI